MTKIVLTIESDALTLSRVLAAIGTHVDATPEIIPSPVVLAASLPPVETIHVPATAEQTYIVAQNTVLPPMPSGDAPMPAADTVERDVTGAVWDAAIHSSNRQKNKDGTWRARRGVTAEVSAPPLESYTPTVSQPVNVTSVMQGAPETVAQAQVPPPGPVVGVPPMPVGDAPVTPAGPVEIKTMAQFMQVYVAATKRAADRGTPINMQVFFGRVGAAIGLELKGPADTNQFDASVQELIFQTGVEILKQDGLDK